jgi:3-oxoacyl-[acyl-carrier-protein] synthase-1
MRRVYFGADNIITSLGFTTEENAGSMLAGISGIKIIEDANLYPGPVAYSAVEPAELESRFENALIKSRIPAAETKGFSRLEKMFFTSITGASEKSGVDPADPRTLMIFSTTKGNIDLIDHRPLTIDHRPLTIDHRPARVLLWEMAGYMAGLFNSSNAPMVVSNACTSGSVAIMQAARLIGAGKYDHAIVTGGDIISGFVVSGFQSFQALSPEPCRPFDAGRTGLSLGEGCGTVILTSDPSKAFEGRPVRYLGGATSNDANHISGPSRDGEGLYLAISAALAEARVLPGAIDFISAHGTATPYNDEIYRPHPGSSRCH